MSSTMKLEFKGFKELITQYEGMGGDCRRAVEAALKESKAYVNKQALSAIRPHRRTGRTENSLNKSMNVEWEGDKASIDVGFEIHNGGLPSIFLMYGTPRMAKDQKLYDAFFGSRTKKDIRKIQEEAINKVIQRTTGGK